MTDQGGPVPAPGPGIVPGGDEEVTVGAQVEGGLAQRLTRMRGEIGWPVGVDQVRLVGTKIVVPEPDRITGV